MFLGRVGQFLGLQLLQGADNAETRVARFDNIIDIAILGCIVRIGKQFGIFSFFFQLGTEPDFLALWPRVHTELLPHLHHP